MYPGEHGRTTPNKAAVIMGSSGTVVTYAELDERSKRLSRYLAEQGLVRGDMVAIFAENNPRYFEVAWAALRSGMYLVTVNRYLQAEEAAYLITDFIVIKLSENRATFQSLYIFSSVKILKKEISKII